MQPKVIRLVAETRAHPIDFPRSADFLKAIFLVARIRTR
jgi:hypothetical protein